MTTQTVSSIVVAGDGSFDEGTATTVTMTIDSPSSINVNLPVTITGTATEGADYTSSFPSLGQEKLLSTFNSNYSNSDILQDGRIVAINSTQLRVYDPSTDQTTNVSLSNNYNYLEVSGNTIYSTSQNGNINSLYLIDISDLAAVTETIQVSLPADNSFNMSISVEANNLLYVTHDSNNNNYNFTNEKEVLTQNYFIHLQVINGGWNLY